MIELSMHTLQEPPLIKMINVNKVGKLLQEIDACDDNILTPITTKAILINDEVKMYLNEYQLDIRKYITPSTLNCIINILEKEDLKISTSITQKHIEEAEKQLTANLTTLETLSESGVLGQKDILITLQALTITNNLTLLQILTNKGYCTYYIDDILLAEAKILLQKLGLEFIIY